MENWKIRGYISIELKDGLQSLIIINHELSSICVIHLLIFLSFLVPLNVFHVWTSTCTQSFGSLGQPADRPVYAPLFRTKHSDMEPSPTVIKSFLHIGCPRISCLSSENTSLSPYTELMVLPLLVSVIPLFASRRLLIISTHSFFDKSLRGISKYIKKSKQLSKLILIAD